MAFWNRKYKDSVFTDLFGTDKTGKENFLALYNALSGSDYKLKEVSLERKVIEQALEQELHLSDAFYEKDSSKLELVVKVKNCSDSKLLPLVKSCDILKEYCRFIEIVELNFDKRHPKRSFQKAIEQAMKEGILVDYLDRKSREVINMLCAKYDYKMDIAVKKEEAFQDGMEAKAVEDARKLLKDGKYTAEEISELLQIPIETFSGAGQA